jgi:hypothetical protein
LSTYREYEPGAPPESDLSQIEAYTRGLTADPGCWTQPVEHREPERQFDTEEADRYDAWVEGMHDAYVREVGEEAAAGWWPGMRDPDAPPQYEAGA